MAIKDLLVAYDGNVGAKKAVQFAVQMAKKYDATITGAHVYKHQSYESHIQRWIPESTLKQLREAEAEAESGLEREFRADVAASGFEGRVNWVTAEGQPNVVLPRLARYFDLMLIGQFTSVFQHERRALQPEDLLLRSGKPMIVVPLGYEPQPFKEEAAVAWDGSRSAARALTDAMQILETKNRLDVLCVDHDDGDDRKSLAPEHDIVEHLRRHEINATQIVLKAGQRTLARTILDYCAEQKPDILVMGAYGRQKFGAAIFGSVTRTILENMNTPLLLSH